MARTVSDDPDSLVRPDLTASPLTCAFQTGAGDGNRTRTISLGGNSMALRRLPPGDSATCRDRDIGGLTVSDRGRPAGNSSSSGTQAGM